MSLQDALRKAAGLLVELPPEEPTLNSSGETLEEFLEKSKEDPLASRSAGDEPSSRSAAANAPAPTKTVEQIVREADGPNLDEIKAGAAPSVSGGANAAGASGGAGAIAAAGKVDCPAIYAAAKLPASPFTAEQMLEMLAGLPTELPLDTKRQTVKVTLGALGKTMGATPETIVADASRKMAALAAYGEHLSRRTDELVARSETEIGALQTQIEEKRKAVGVARGNLAQNTQMCQTESERLDDVLEFFSLDVAPSKYAPAGTAPPNAAAPGVAPANATNAVSGARASGAASSSVARGQTAK